MEDAQILELFWKRDENALKAVDEKYNAYCFKIAWDMLKSREDSEECVNDTWFSAWKYIPPKRPTVLSVFLGRITRGFAIDRLRKKYAEKRPDLHIMEFQQELGELNRLTENILEERLERQELAELFSSFLKGLKLRERDIFIQRYWKMVSIREIAQRHGISESAVKQSLFRTRKKLRRRLEEEGKR